MCALDGALSLPPQRAAGLRVAHVVCRFSRAGLSHWVGVPDGGGPLVLEDALRARLRDFPRLRAHVADVGTLACEPSQIGATLRFCVDGTPANARLQCVLEADDSVSCAQRDPERFLTACRRRFPDAPIRASERYWAPGLYAAPSDRVRDGQVLEPVHNDSSYRADGKLVLRVQGREVRVASCETAAGPRDAGYLVDGEDVPLTIGELAPRLDDDRMRAVLFAETIEGAGQTVLLDPLGSRPGCRFPSGPRRRGQRLEFTMAPALAGPLLRCGIDVNGARGSCTPIPTGIDCRP